MSLSIFKQSFDVSSLVAIYIKNSQGAQELSFYYKPTDSRYTITNRQLNDTLFFRSLAKECNMSKQQFLNMLDRVSVHGKTQKHVSVPGTVHIVTYCIIYDLDMYLKDIE